VNILAHWYAALNPEMRLTQVLRALALWNKTSISKLLRMKDTRKDSSKNWKSTQGERTVKNIEEVHAATLNPAVTSAAKSFLGAIQSPAAEPLGPGSTSPKYCVLISMTS
jgi:hypothetical protein